MCFIDAPQLRHLEMFLFQCHFLRGREIDKNMDERETSLLGCLLHTPVGIEPVLTRNRTVTSIV